MVGAMSRSALASIIYQKSLTLSNKVYSLTFANQRRVWNIQMGRSQTWCPQTPPVLIMVPNTFIKRGQPSYRCVSFSSFYSSTLDIRLWQDLDSWLFVAPSSEKSYGNSIRKDGNPQNSQMQEFDLCRKFSARCVRLNSMHGKNHSSVECLKYGNPSWKSYGIYCC